MAKDTKPVIQGRLHVPEKRGSDGKDMTVTRTDLRLYTPEGCKLIRRFKILAWLSFIVFIVACIIGMRTLDNDFVVWATVWTMVLDMPVIIFFMTRLDAVEQENKYRVVETTNRSRQQIRPMVTIITDVEQACSYCNTPVQPSETHCPGCGGPRGV